MGLLVAVCCTGEIYGMLLPLEGKQCMVESDE